MLCSLADAARAYPLERKLLVCARPAHGRELLRALAHAGMPWIGFDVATPAQLALELLTAELATEQVWPTDEFDELALLDAAMDEVLGEATDGLAGLAEGFGLRQAIVQAVRALRLAGVGEPALERARFRDEQKRAQLARILAVYERALETAQRIDTAGVLRRANAALALGTLMPPYAHIYILPGQTRRGLAGQLLDVLLERGATVLPSDPVFGLPRPPLWLDGAAVPLSTDDAMRAGATSLSWLHTVADAPAVAHGVEVRMFAASALMSEVREVLRRIVASGLRWDEVEIIATDAIAYGVALDTLARRLRIPVSYALGLPIGRTRPGRAVAKYLEWIETGFPADVLRQMLERGDIAPARDSGVSGIALARTLRRMKIGRGHARYGRAIARLQALLAAPQPPDDDRSPGEFAEERARERAELDALVQCIGPLLQATPVVDERSDAALASPAAIGRGLLELLRMVPVTTAVDATAKKRLRARIDRIAALLERPTSLAGAIAVIASKLEDRVPAPDEPDQAPWHASGGYLHLSDIAHGGYSCRRATFIVGLDAARFPGAGFRDALLVDDDRRRIASGGGTATLPTAAERVDERRYGLAALLARLRGTVTFSYAAWDAVEGRAVAPASELLQAYRLCTHDPFADYEALHRALAPAASPVPQAAALDADDVWFGVLAHNGRLRAGVPAVIAVYPGLNAGVRAFRERSGPVPTARHGIVQPRPGMDPRDTDRVTSAAQLQTLGTCPHRYLLRYVLGVHKPDDPELSSEEWLTPLDRGALMHTVYERALSVARDEQIVPSDDAFEQRVLEIVAEEAERLRDVVPPPGDAIYRMECELLAEDARAFVAMAREDGDRHIALERKFGRDGTVPARITLPDGRTLLVSGAIDRVDALDDGRLVIIDYKTGRRTRFGPKNGNYDGGRRLQHVIYAAVARTLFRADVARAEYHFPTRLSENYRAAFELPVLNDGLSVIGELLDLAARGQFVPTNDPEDCTFCDFAAVCRVRPLPYGRYQSPLADWARNVRSDVLDTLRKLR